MKSNFDFLKSVDENLYDSILDAEKLFRDEYFSQCCVQLRVFAEKTAKKILKNYPPESTFDDIINTLKDKIQTERDKEFVEDLFFIKREGNKCAHGEETSVSATLEAIRRAFEISIYYGNIIKKGNKFDKLQFDDTLLVTGKPLKEERLVDKYVKLAEEQREELLNAKQNEFSSNVEKTTEDGFEDKNFIKPKKKKELTPAQKRVKEKVKLAKKNIKENINNSVKKTDKKTPKPPKKNNKTAKPKPKKRNRKKIPLKYILFILFVIISLYFLTKMLFFF